MGAGGRNREERGYFLLKESAIALLSSELNESMQQKL